MLDFMASKAIHPPDDSCPSLAHILLSMRLIKTSIRLKVAHSNLPGSEGQRENIRLVRAAETPMSSICFSFCERGITRDAYSFLDKLPKGDLNSTPSPFTSRAIWNSLSTPTSPIASGPLSHPSSLRD
jgi:hypothetical protein